MDLPRKPAVVFDLESAIDAFRWSCELGFQAVERLALERFGIDAFATRCGGFSNSLQIDTYFSRAFAGIRQRVTAKDVKDFSECFRRHGQTAALSRETIQVFDQLRESYLLVALVGGPPEQARIQVRQSMIERWVDRVVIPEYWGCSFGMPHPRAFLSVQNCRGLSPRHCTFVAKPTHQGLETAHRLGWSTLVVASGERDRIDSGDSELVSIKFLPKALNRRAAA